MQDKIRPEVQRQNVDKLRQALIQLLPSTPPITRMC